MQKRYFTFILALILFSAHLLEAQNQNIVQRSTMVFPGQTLANICGYAAGGREYALLGGSQGMIVVDVTDPDNPVQIVQIPGVDDLWKEIKTYSHYAYITSEGNNGGAGDGVQIVDLSNLPSANLPYHHYKGDGSIANQLQTIHALHIDVTKGYLYAYGSNIASGGAIVLNLNNDPYNPTYAGQFSTLGYIHDGYVDNDTLYASHIYTGFFSVVNMADKSNPVIISTQDTPNKFTHNTWISKDRKVIFATDETTDSYLSSWDVSDPTDIKPLHQIQSNPGSKSIVHNTHILNNYAVTSWYRDGLTIVDATKPEHLVQVGNFDTYPQGTGNGFEGCWGVYPYFPSGTLVASNMTVPGVVDGELYVLTPTYVRACYLEGIITDAATGAPLLGAEITINSGDANAVTASGNDGSYKNGQAMPGNFTVTVSKLGYISQTLPVVLETAQTTVLNVALESAPFATISGKVVRASDGQPIPNAFVSVISNAISFSAQADANGDYSVQNIYLGDYDIVAGAWGYLQKVLPAQSLSGNLTYTIAMDAGYQDDFIFDLGWEKNGTSATGKWELGDPIGVDVGVLLAPENDIDTDLGNTCYVTGNSTGEVDIDDVESGTSVLISPPMNLTNYQDPILNYSLWCTSFNINQQSLDSIKVYLVSGTQTVLIDKYRGDFPDWHVAAKHAKNYLPLADNMRLRIVGFDNPSFVGLDSYEAAFDGFLVTEGTVGTNAPQAWGAVEIAPNPFYQSTTVQFETTGGEFTAKIYDLAGKCMESRPLEGQSGSITVGENLPAGAFLLQIEKEGIAVKTVKLIKVNQ